MRRVSFDHRELFYFGHGTQASLFGIYPFGKEWWRRWLVLPVWRVGASIRDGIWWLRYRNPFGNHQYHLINTRMEPGYYDYDARILHGCFAMLCEYVEEMGGEMELEKFNRELWTAPDPNEPDGLSARQADRQNEALVLYRWWKYQRPADQKREDELLDLAYSDTRMVSGPLEETVLLGKTIKVRPVTWEYNGPLTPEAREQARDDHHKMELKIADDEQTMLKRLIDIRPGLWT